MDHRRFTHNSMATETTVRIDVWSDYVCPFCYLELPVLQKLQKAFGDRVHVAWRAFELRPDPHPTLDPAGEYLRTTWEKSVYPMAKERGMTLRLPPVQPRSRKAFEAAIFAAGHDRFDAMHQALFKAFFEDGRDIGDAAVLRKIADSTGLPGTALHEALNDGLHEAQVLLDQALAHRLGVSGVPIAVLRQGEAAWEDAIALQGAVPYAHLEAVVSQILEPGTMQNSTRASSL
jgi:predicted DsbA family dithiol-disulfide isomerase